MEIDPIKHVCGQCGEEWLTEAEYVAHVCPKTGFTPAQPENLGAEFVAVQKAALERGLERIDPAADPEQHAAQQEAIQQLPTEPTAPSE